MTPHNIHCHVGDSFGGKKCLIKYHTANHRIKGLNQLLLLPLSIIKRVWYKISYLIYKDIIVFTIS